MAYNSCDPCASNCGPGAAFLDPQSARISIGIILCQIKELLASGGPPAAVTVIGGSLTANAGTGFPPVVTDGAAAGTQGIHILGTDGVNAQILSTDAAGVLNVNGSFAPAAPTEIDPIFSEYPFASILGAYTVALANALPVKILDVLNDTDEDLLISFNGATDHMLLKAGTGKLYDLATNGLELSTSVSVKHNGVAPTLGSLVTTLVR